MKSIIKFSCLVFVLIFVWQKASSQIIEMNSTDDPFKLDGFTLIYGNVSYNIYDFDFIKEYKVLLLTKKDGALFVLLNHENLALDNLFIKSAPANIKFWHNEDNFYYQSIFFYKSNICNLNYKPGVASFHISNDSLKFNECFSIEDSYVRKELFQMTKNFKITLLEKEQKRKKKNKNNDELNKMKNIGFSIDGKYIVKRKAPPLSSTLNTFFPYVELNEQLLVFDVINNTLYKFNKKGASIKTVIENNVLYKDTLNSFVSYELISDNSFNELYLLASQRIKHQRKGREKQTFTENQLLYKLKENKWENTKLSFPRFSYKMHINLKKVYSIFDVEDERGISKKMLYVSDKFLINN